MAIGSKTIKLSSIIIFKKKWTMKLCDLKTVWPRVGEHATMVHLYSLNFWIISMTVDTYSTHLKIIKYILHWIPSSIGTDHIQSLPKINPANDLQSLQGYTGEKQLFVRCNCWDVYGYVTYEGIFNEIVCQTYAMLLNVYLRASRLH